MVKEGSRVHSVYSGNIWRVEHILQSCDVNVINSDTCVKYRFDFHGIPKWSLEIAKEEAFSSYLHLKQGVSFNSFRVDYLAREKVLMYECTGRIYYLLFSSFSLN